MQKRKLFCLGHGAVFVGLFALMMLAGQCTSSVHEATTYTDNGNNSSVHFSYSSTANDVDAPMCNTSEPEVENPLFTHQDYVAINNSLFYTIVLGFGMLVSASMAFWEMKRKSSRMRLLTLPVSTLEKFLAKVAIYVVAFTLTLVVMFIVLDFIRIGIYSLLYPKLYTQHFLSFVSMMLKQGGEEYHVLALITMAILWTLLNQAIYFLGGTIFSRYAFFKTFIATLVVGNVLSIVLFYLGLPSLWSFSDSIHQSLDYIYAMNALLTVATIGCYVGAYYVFKRKQLV